MAGYSRAFVTGAASGLGLAIAQQLGRGGTACFLCDINAEGLAHAYVPAVADTVHRRSVLDVADRDAMLATVEACVADCGVPDLIVLNAGITTTGAPIEEIEPAQWSRILAVNLGGVLNGLQAWLPRLKQAGQPASLLITGSILSHFGLPRAADYVATKHAVLGLAEVAALELCGTPIGVTLACPGLIDTRLSATRAADAMLDRPAGIPAATAAARILEAAPVRLRTQGTMALGSPFPITYGSRSSAPCVLHRSGLRGLRRSRLPRWSACQDQ